ncbi:MAG: hypothetical protein C4582_01720 [Desulfobacteraceae bacterium]|jgi:hypothetical protein|nr:MAG: hypothetical protein C4582_01720 [Desulfobacteraceae bacterium]
MPVKEETATRPNLNEEDRFMISELFQEQVAGKLRKLHARSGVISCGFAGEKYRHWLIQFRSAGSGFEIVDFDFDERAEDLGLDL